MLLKQENEITILGNYNSPLLAGSKEYLMVFRSKMAEAGHRKCLHIEILRDPRSEMRGQLGI